MKKNIIEIIAGATTACVLFLICTQIIGPFYQLCLVKKFAYATLIGMPLGSFIGINLVDSLLYSSKEFTFVGTLAGLALTMIVLLSAIYVVAVVPAAFFVMPILISASFLAGHRLGPRILQLKRQVVIHRAIE
jgi:hypothetical protein